jgi:5-methylcytosine-specific restriction endonuclease McrA
VHRTLNSRRKARVRAGGELSISTVRQVYEENIKKYGTLTCYLCKNPISFGADHLEHKIPLSRGGTNIRENLDIAHKSCNSKKGRKTEKEYLCQIHQEVQAQQYR